MKDVIQLLAFDLLIDIAKRKGEPACDTIHQFHNDPEFCLAVMQDAKDLYDGIRAAA